MPSTKTLKASKSSMLPSQRVSEAPQSKPARVQIELDVSNPVEKKPLKRDAKRDAYTWYNQVQEVPIKSLLVQQALLESKSNSSRTSEHPVSGQESQQT